MVSFALLLEKESILLMVDPRPRWSTSNVHSGIMVGKAVTRDHPLAGSGIPGGRDEEHLSSRPTAMKESRLRAGLLRDPLESVFRSLVPIAIKLFACLATNDSRWQGARFEMTINMISLFYSGPLYQPLVFRASANLNEST